MTSTHIRRDSINRPPRVKVTGQPRMLGYMGYRLLAVADRASLDPPQNW